ncbi:MAG: BREX-4 system phosphatase PglZ [Treponema sp.]|nr:BREX-4 system phosphatase PglZ [Treponema sp.]
MSRTYTLNEYYPYTDSVAARAEVYSDNATAAALLAYHKQKGAVEIPVWECVGVDTPILPMPRTVMDAMDERIRAANKRVIITGVDAYLSLLNEQNIEAFMVALHGRIDKGTLNAVYMISETRFSGALFSNPKFENSFMVVHIGGDRQHLSQPAFTVVSDKYVRSENNPTSWRDLLKMIGQYEATGSYTLVLSKYAGKQAGLSGSVSQLRDIAEIAGWYYGISVNLPENALEMLMEKCKEGNHSPLEYLKAQVDENHVNTRLAVKRLFDLRNDELWDAYVWLLQKTIDKRSYLSQVLAAAINKDNLLRKYVFEAAISLLNDRNAADFAAERAAAIKELGAFADALIVEFIGNIKERSDEEAACWLNCGTEAERVEIIRRVSQSNLTIGLPQLWNGLYPLLEDYLSDIYDYSSEYLTAYFRDYRRFKVANTVTESFVKRAFDAALPADIVSRDSVLQELSANKGAALLVVDGMGAEYYPLVRAMAKRRGMNIASATVAAVRLPSSTQFNRLQWDADRILTPEIHEIDNISHNGAVEYERCPFEQNITAALAAFETIINRIANGLVNYECVVVTADHGSSRLAVIAHDKGLDKDLPWNGAPLDWRYAIAPPKTECPPEFEPYYDEQKNTTYWVVRGYNRLPKKGGKLSVHGGAALEERLVPVIVFSKGKPETEPEQLDKQTVPQLVEKEDFNI